MRLAGFYGVYSTITPPTPLDVLRTHYTSIIFSYRSSNMNNQQKTPQNTAKITIRADDYLIQQFHEAAKDNDTTASQLIRGFMRDYLKKNRQRKLL